jgi:hypothetical protein
MVKNIDLTAVNTNIFSKEESRLIEKLNRCKTRKCAKLHKEREKEGKLFTKEQDIACPQKSNTAFYDCSVGFYERSKYKKLFDRFVECAKKKCHKEKKTLKKLRDKQEYNFIMKAVLGQSDSKKI